MSKEDFILFYLQEQIQESRSLISCMNTKHGQVPSSHWSAPHCYLSSYKAFSHLLRFNSRTLPKESHQSVCSPRCLSRVDLLHHLRKLWMSSRKLPKHFRHMKSKKAEGYRSRDKNNRFWILWDWELRHICERQHGSQSLHDLFSCHRPSEQLISHKYLPSSPMLQYALTEGNCC